MRITGTIYEMMVNRKYLLVIMPLIFLVILVVIWFLRGNEFRMNVKESHRLSLDASFALSIAQMKELQADREFNLVDLREENDYAVGHADGALSVPMKSLLEKEALHFFRTSQKPIILYSDDMAQTATAYALLIQIGINSIYILELPDGMILTDTIDQNVISYKNEELRFIFEPDTAVFNVAQNSPE